MITVDDIIKLEDIPYGQWAEYSSFGARYVDNISLGIRYPRHPHRSVALRKIIKLFGKPTYEDDGDEKVTFEYVFSSKNFIDVYFRVYDYKKSMSCGLSVRKDAIITKAQADRINKELEEILDLLYAEDTPLPIPKEPTGRRIHVRGENEI